MGDGVYLVSGVYLRLVLTSYVFFLVIYSDGMPNQHTAILSPSRKVASVVMLWAKILYYLQFLSPIHASSLKCTNEEEYFLNTVSEITSQQFCNDVRTPFLR